MFDRMTKRLAAKAGKAVKETVEPIKMEIRDHASNKVDLYSRVVRLGVLILLFIDGTRRISSKEKDITDPTNPNTIVINNYIRDRKDGD